MDIQNKKFLIFLRNTFKEQVLNSFGNLFQTFALAICIVRLKKTNEHIELFA